MGIYEKLSSIQEELKAPKNAYNSFGKYNYRSCEDILEGLKPVLKKYKATLFISDSLELIGDRYYVKAAVRLVDIETGETVENTAYAREELDKKGMDWSQITGATSSYARKYALNGMFLIDDTKDALFVARENGKPEFVGSFGNKAAVANNEQIVTAVANGVSMANESIKNAIENQTNILADTINNKDVNVQIGDRQIAEANNRGQKGLGNRFVD